MAAPAQQLWCDTCETFTQVAHGTVTDELFCYECGETYTCAECSAPLTDDDACPQCGATDPVV